MADPQVEREGGERKRARIGNKDHGINLEEEANRCTTTFPDILALKRDGFALNQEQIACIVRGVVTNKLGPEQLGAFLMAVFLQGMNTEETVTLTRCMLYSGSKLTWPEHMQDKLVDKHSTGGVGDKVSLPLAPALAACGMYVPMISGRGLGHTGGTLDKLESIPGYQVALQEEQLLSQVEKVGCAICGQTGDIAPADRRMYAVRDVTGTVESIPLISGSIVCKKAAESPSALVLDVKVGSAAFMRTEKRALELAKCMQAVSRGLGIRTAVALTRMDAPLGFAIGNALEVRESVDCLRGGGPKDLRKLVCTLGGMVLAEQGIVENVKAGMDKIAKVLDDGSAFQKFHDMVAAQGGDVKALSDDLGRNKEANCEPCMPRAAHQSEIVATKSGYVSAIDALKLAKVSLELGAGRLQVGAAVDHAVGLELQVQLGDRVEAGAPWIRVHHQKELTIDHLQRLQESLTVQDDVYQAPDLIIQVL